MFLFRLPPRPGKLRPSRAHRCKFAAFSAGRKAAGRIRRCGLLHSFGCKFRIQNSKLQTRGAACGARIFGYELRASAAGRLRAAAPIRAQIQNSKFKIQNYALGRQPAENRSKRTCGTRVAGLRPPGCGPPTSNEVECTAKSINNCGPPIPAGSISLSRPARSRADGPATIRSSPPPGGGCGLPTSATSSLLKNISATAGGCGLPTATKQANRKAPDRTTRPSDQRS